MKNLKTLSFVLVVLLMASFAYGQTATTSTTLSAAVTSASAQNIVVGSATNINAPTASHSGSKLYVDREVMDVTAVNSTTISVIRGTGGTVAAPHVSGATVYVGYASVQGVQTAFRNQLFSGACTAANMPYLPAIFTDSVYEGGGFIMDCFAGKWQYDMNWPLYKFTVAPNAQRSAASPSAGSANSIVAQAGGASSNASNPGGAGGAATFNAGAGGAGASTGTAGAGGALNLAAGAGGAAAGAAAVGGAGGAVAIAGGASGGTITSGNGGAVTITGGASANGSTAAGNGGAVTIGSGAVGTGGTGVAGTLTLKVGATTVYNGASTNVGGLTSTYACGAALAANGACANTATAGNAHIIYGSAVLGSNTSTITGISPAFTSTSTFFCVGNDITTRANPVQVIPASGSSITITNTTGASDTVQYICVGN